MRKRSLLQSLRDAGRGLRYAIGTQRHVKIHLAAAAAVTVACAVLRTTLVESLLVLLTVALVLAAEILNTALEVVVDRLTPGHHDHARIIKDLAAGAVLLCCLAAVGVGAAIFLHAFWRLQP